MLKDGFGHTSLQVAGRFFLCCSKLLVSKLYSMAEGHIHLFQHK